MKIKFLILCSFIILSITLYKWRGEEVPRSSCELSIYSYSSFASSWGAGPKLVEAFQKKHACHLKIIDAGDGRTMFQRIRTELKMKKPVPDIVIGFDQTMLQDARELTEWEEMRVKLPFSDEFPQETVFSMFLPFDWAPFSFVTRKSSGVQLRTLEDLLDTQNKTQFSLMDPRTSTPGFHLMNWIVYAFPDSYEEKMRSIRENAHSVFPSWSSNYGLFKKGVTKFTFSYLTSPIYHKVEEKDENFVSIKMNGSLPYQVEYVGVPKRSKNQEFAKKFVEFLFSHGAQKLLMEKNYMLPVRKGVISGTAFEDIKKMNLIKNYHLINHRGEIERIWSNP